MNKKHIIAITIGVVILSALPASSGKWPWQRRIGRDVDVHHKLQYQRVSPDMWPEEPKSPALVDAPTFERSLGYLCGMMPEVRLKKYSAAILEEAAAFEIDPFLLAALIQDRSGCRPKTPDNATKYGLSRIDVDMHAPHIRGGLYKYFVRDEGEWKQQELQADKYPFNKWKAAKWNSNIYWTAVILRVFKEQHESLDEAFPARPHRHYVSHWFFGDNVREIEPEDRVLTIRRRLISYYNQDNPVPAGDFNGTPLVSPLDGVPRLVLDDFGNRRGKKHGPGHQGMDFQSELGEPVRAVAPGRVVFAGVDMPTGPSKMLSPSETNVFPPKKMGSGGRYVAINHGEGFRTYYMHLNTTTVKDWDQVEAGQIIGTVGRSGAAQSGPHLHLEFRNGKDRVDPAVYLAPVLVDPDRITSKEE